MRRCAHSASSGAYARPTNLNRGGPHAQVHRRTHLPQRARDPNRQRRRRNLRDRREAKRELGVTWIHSYVGDDKKTTFCVYDAPTPDAIRATATANDLPIDRITEVQVLDPYFYS